MGRLIEGNPFIWVMIQGEAGNEHYVGQHDTETDISFVPGFLSKDEALKAYHLIKSDKGVKFEVQAIRYKELCRDCANNGFLLFMLDADGKILEKITPGMDQPT